jgi:hypothetical protein
MAAKRNQKSLNTKKARSVTVGTSKSRKSRKLSASKAAPIPKRPARKKTRRSAAEVAKLRKAVISGLRGGTSAADLARRFGVTTPYIYMLKTAA